MADIRCPMCGRPNPPEQEVCRFCQARLKPLVVSPFTGDGSPLKPGETPVPRNTSDLEPTLPDWLRELRGREDAESELTPQDALPDWLSEQTEDTSASESAGSGDAVDWLRDLRGEGETISARQETPPDWLSEEAGQAIPSSEAGMEAPADWWSRISSESEQPAEPPEPQDISGETPAVEPARSLFFASQESEKQPGENEEPGKELPDWLAALSSDDFMGYQEETPSGVSDEPSAEGESEEPDWLRRVRERQQAEEQPRVSAFLPEEQTSEADEGPFEFAAQDKDLPDWLSSPLPQESDRQESPQGLPDWFTQSQLEAVPETPAPEEGAPNWLTGLGPRDDDEFPWTESAEPGEQPLATLPEEEGTPDWLKNLEASAAVSPAGPAVPAFIFDEETGPAFDLGQETASDVQEAEKGEEEAPLPYLSTLPEWISQVSAEAESAESASEEEQAPDLAPAQLPNWLEAMRPVEAVAPAAPVGEEQAAQVEKVGPLAGLRGVIPAEPLVGHLRKPPAYSIKLQVSATQQRRVALLQKLLEAEGQAKPVPLRAAFSSQAVLRLIIAVALCVAVLVPVWLNSQRLPLPDPTYIPDGIIETNALINSIQPNAPVLLAIDYEPGLSAEMDAAATTIVNGVAARGAALALVSTNPTGPLLAERLMSNLNRGRGTALINYANLGYIAGGPAGLRSFAHAPRKILPYDLGNSTQPPRADLWLTGSFANVQTVAHFAMVVVFTEDPDNARYWIEQVQPLLQPNSVPLLMIVSAQAEPMVRPYFEAYPRQVHGLVAGLNGVAAYEGISGQSGLARLYWDAFGAGLLVVEALILVGGLINLVLALFMPRKEAEREGNP